MSSLQSDPQFARGTTLLAGADIDLNGSTPIAGSGIVGTVKVFQDTNPSTGVVASNRLVYCMAVRVFKTGVLSGASSTFVAGDVLELTQTTGGVTAAALSGVASPLWGVVDEYIPSGVVIRNNDIIWVVVKGPATVTATATAITSGADVILTATAGKIAAGTRTVVLGVGVALEAAGSGGPVRVLVTGSNLA